MTLTHQHHRWIHLGALAAIAAGLPFSNFLMSVGEIVLAVHFLIQGRWDERWRLAKQNPALWLFVAVFVAHLVGLAYTDNWHRGLNDIRIKLPLLLMPLALALGPRLRRTELLWIGALFSASVIATSIFSTVQYVESIRAVGSNFRDLSLFNSHIRFGLMVCLSYLILLNCAWNEEKKTWLRVLYVLLAIWTGAFLFILQSLTAIVIWFLCSYFLLIYTLNYIKNKLVRGLGVAVLLVTPVMVVGYLWAEIDDFFPDKEPAQMVLETHTRSGELYLHDLHSTASENGHYTHLYLAPSELGQAWNERSAITYPDGFDAQRHFIKTTLERYLTSRGLRKDRDGVMALTDADIAAIEAGVANHRFLNDNGLSNRVYVVIWEINKWLGERRVQGHSVTQRIEFWRTGWGIFAENWLFGVGTGDVFRAFQTAYANNQSELELSNRLKSHNQYLEIGVALGVFGLALFFASLFWPFFSLGSANSFLFIGFTMVLCASFITEDTLETQAGATLYAFFNALLLFWRSGYRLLANTRL